MRPFLLSIFTLLLAGDPVTAQDSHNPYTALLQAHVRDGKVNYRELCKDNRLSDYIKQLTASNPDSIPNSKERLAFWINAYNAYTLKVICDNYPIKSINDLHSGGLVVGSIFKTTIWDRDVVTINNRKLTLNEIEHKIVRPKFKDPRAHFALNCASKSCPILRPEAYEGDKLDKQLEDQARLFFNDPAVNHFDAEKKVAYLSKIFDWYGSDFGKNKEAVLQYISQFLPDPHAEDIRQNARDWKIEYTYYDWSLNE